MPTVDLPPFPADGMEPETARQRAGRLGGKATSKKLGKEHYRRIGKIGGQSRYKPPK